MHISKHSLLVPFPGVTRRERHRPLARGRRTHRGGKAATWNQPQPEELRDASDL